MFHNFPLTSTATSKANNDTKKKLNLDMLNNTSSDNASNISISSTSSSNISNSNLTQKYPTQHNPVPSLETPQITIPAVSIPSISQSSSKRLNPQHSKFPLMLNSNPPYPFFYCEYCQKISDTTYFCYNKECNFKRKLKQFKYYNLPNHYTLEQVVENCSKVYVYEENICNKNKLYEPYITRCHVEDEFVNGKKVKKDHPGFCKFCKLSGDNKINNLDNDDSYDDSPVDNNSDTSFSNKNEDTSCNQHDDINIGNKANSDYSDSDSYGDNHSDSSTSSNSFIYNNNNNNENDDWDANFYERNNSRYRGHLINTHGVHPNGSRCKLPENGVCCYKWIRNHWFETSGFNCPYLNCTETFALGEKSHGFHEYLRHWSRTHADNK